LGFTIGKSWLAEDGEWSAHRDNTALLFVSLGDLEAEVLDSQIKPGKGFRF
jgi:hypothetical protein